MASLLWGAIFIALFVLDGGSPDPAALKNLLLPGMLGLLLALGGRAPTSRWILAGIAFFVWSFARIGSMAVPGEVVLGISACMFAFLSGASGILPAPLVALAALGIAIGKGWDDLLFARNVGGGIPFTPTSFFVHRNMFALMLAPALLLAAMHAREAKERWVRIGTSVILLLGAGLLLVGESRGALAGLFAGIALVVAYKPATAHPVAGWKRFWIVAGIAIVLLGALHQRVKQSVDEGLAVLRAEPITENVSQRFRPWVWAGSMRLWQESPWTGIGVGDFQHRIESTLDPWMDSHRDRRMKVGAAHSHWLQTLVERGVVGLLLELAACIAGIVLSLRRGNAWLAGALACIGVHALVAEGMETTQCAVLWWFLLGCATHGRGRLVEGRRVRLTAVLGLVVLALPLWSEGRRYIADRRIDAVAKTNVAFDQDSFQQWLDASPRSPALWHMAARELVRSGNLEGATVALEHLRAIYPSLGAVDVEIPLMEAWRTTGKTDSVKFLLAKMVRSYPNDPWVWHERLLLERQTRGCSGVRLVLDSIRPRMDELLLDRRPQPLWNTWRSRLCLDGEAAARARNSIEAASQAPWLASRSQWIAARSVCEDFKGSVAGAE